MQVAVAALLLLLLLSASVVAQRTPITNRNIKSAVSDWRTSPTNATTKYGDIGGWNVATVTDMSKLFFSKDGFNEDLGRWNVASVSNMYCLFSEAAAFDQNIGSWNTAKVSNMNLDVRAGGGVQPEPRRLEHSVGQHHELDVLLCGRVQP